MPRAVVLVFDSLGIGAAPDAVRFGDVGADTLGHVARHAAQQGRPLRLPQLGALGLALIGLGGGRRLASDRIDHRVGFSQVLPVGTPVVAGQPLLWVHAASDAQAQAALRDLAACVPVTPAPPRLGPVLIEHLV